MSGFIFERQSTYCTIQYVPNLAELDWQTVEQAKRDVHEQLLNAPTHSMLIDLSAVKQLQSDLVASLVQTWQHLNNGQRRCVLVTTDNKVHQALQPAGLTPLWQTAKTMTEARQTLGISEQSNSAAASPANAMIFEDFKRYCSIQFDPQLTSMGWSDVEATTSEVIEKLKDSKNTSVMVDLSTMDYINSGLVASLVRIWKTMKERDGQFSLVCPNEAVTDVLKTAGLWKLWSVVDQREEAVYDLGASKVAIAENREGRLLTFVSVACAAVAALALAVMFNRGGTAEAVDSQLAALLLAAAALTTGLIAIFKESGPRRLLSVVAVIASIGVLSTLFLKTSPISFGRQPAETTQEELTPSNHSDTPSDEANTTNADSSSESNSDAEANENSSNDPSSSDATP